MDFTVSRSDLFKALQITQNAVARKTAMPVLFNILLSASGNELRVSASDLEMTVLSILPSKVRSGGSTTINAKIFSELVRELPEADVNIKLKEGERIEIAAKSSRFKIVGVSAEEYPSLPGIILQPNGKISAATLLEMINRTLYAVSSDQTRFNLNGVCFEPGETDSTLRLVATDGHRLAFVSRSAKNFELDKRIIVPKRGLTEIKKILEEEGDKEIAVDVQEGFFLIECGGFKVAMRLIDGEFPDCSNAIPKDNGAVATVNSGDFIKALRRVMLVVSDKEKFVRMNFSAESLRFSTSSPELGEAAEEIEVDYQAEPLTIGFNAMYLIELAAAMGESARLCIELHGEFGPGKFYAQDDESSLAIVMPMRL